MIDRVRLTEAEERIADWVGEQRYYHARTAGRHPGHGPTSRASNAENDRRGARSEYAGSIILNVYWRPTIGSIRDRDVGGLIEIKSTPLPNGRLIMQPGYKGNAPFGLIVIDNGMYRFAGWLWADEIRKFPILSYPNAEPLHYAEQKFLRPQDELIREVINART